MAALEKKSQCQYVYFANWWYSNYQRILTIKKEVRISCSTFWFIQNRHSMNRIMEVSTIFPFCSSFSWGWSWSLPPVQWHEPPSIVLPVLYQISSLELICHFHCIIIRDLIRSYLNGLVVFPTFFNLSLNLAIRSWWCEPHPAPASLVAQRLKCLPAMQETRVRSLGQEDPLEKEMAPHSSILAWRIPWTEEPGRL